MPWMYFQITGMIRKNEKWKKNLCYFLLAIFFMLFLLRNAFLRLKTFFQRILKIFLLVVWRIRDHFWFRIGVGEHDFILNFWIWKPEDENRSEFRPAVNRISKVLPRFKFIRFSKVPYALRTFRHIGFFSWVFVRKS